MNRGQSQVKKTTDFNRGKSYERYAKSKKHRNEQDTKNLTKELKNSKT